MAIIREHLARKGLGLHNDLQNESSIVGNFPTVLMMRDFGTDGQKAEWMPGFLDGSRRLACEAADRAMQTCGGVGYSRHMPFEHIYRHHRRYRITEGAEEIQMRKVAQELFGFGRSSRT